MLFPPLVSPSGLRYDWLVAMRDDADGRRKGDSAVGVFDYIAGRARTATSGREGHFGSDLSNFPLVHITSPDVAEYESVNIPSFFEAVDAGLARSVAFAVLHDARGLPPVDVARRCQFVDMVNGRRGDIEQRVVAYAAIVDSPFERGLITAFAWFVQVPLPVRLFSRRAEAEAWLGERLRMDRTGQVRGSATGC